MAKSTTLNPWHGYLAFRLGSFPGRAMDAWHETAKGHLRLENLAFQRQADEEALTAINELAKFVPDGSVVRSAKDGLMTWKSNVESSVRETQNRLVGDPALALFIENNLPDAIRPFCD